MAKSNAAFVHVGGGLGSAPYIAKIYSEFRLNKKCSLDDYAGIRIFDRYANGAANEKARMCFAPMRAGKFKAAVDAEREIIGELPPLSDYLEEVAEPELKAAVPQLNVLDSITSDPNYQQWAKDNVIPHRIEGLCGVHVRTKLGDITSDRARELADIARQFSASELRVSIEQNLFLPWVRVEDLPALYQALQQSALHDAGAETIADVTACPGADTCRLGIASAKGLGSAISESFFTGTLAPYREINRDLRIKISGCPNGCAQHAVGNIGFHAAALSSNGRNVPSHILFLGGSANHGHPTAGKIVGKFPARAGIQVVETLLKLHNDERLEGEDFNSFLARIGDQRVKEVLEPLRAVPTFEADPTFYDDYGHENEKFTVRSGVRGECAGTTIAEIVPTFADANERLSQAAAQLHHGNYEAAQLEAYEAAAKAARVPLYQHLLTHHFLEALWSFENIFVLSGKTNGEWSEFSANFEALKSAAADEANAQAAVEKARAFVSFCEQLRIESGVAIFHRSGQRAAWHERSLIYSLCLCSFVPLR